MDKQASRATWSWFPHVLGKPEVLWPISAGVGSSHCSPGPSSEGRPVPSAFGVQDVMLSRCQHSLSPCLVCLTPLHCSFFLNCVVPLTALAVCDGSPFLFAHHRLPVLRSKQEFFQLPEGLSCGLRAADPSPAPPMTLLIISRVHHELAACKCKRMDSV